MDIIKEIFKFFIAKEYSFASKFVSLIVFALVIISIDNLIGFSFYYGTNQKINQLKNIENLKNECKGNEKLIKELNVTENEILARKNILQNFFELFSKEPFDKEVLNLDENKDTIYITKYDTIIITINKFFPKWHFERYDSVANVYDRTKQREVLVLKDTISLMKKDSSIKNQTDSVHSKFSNLKNQSREAIKSRSKIWHTISSSCLLIIIFILLPFIPFAEKKYNWNTFVGAIIFMLFDAGIIWLSQFLFGLIPVILNRPWINYSVNFVVSSLFWTIILILIFGDKKTNAT